MEAPYGRFESFPSHARPASSHYPLPVAGIEVAKLEDHGDVRGRSWLLAEGLRFLNGVEDIHMMTLLPGHTRGQHFHERKREVLVVEHEGSWCLRWDDGDGEEPQAQAFDGSGAVMVSIPPGCAHAIENCGTGSMRVLGLSDRRYDPDDPDSPNRYVGGAEVRRRTASDP